MRTNREWVRRAVERRETVPVPYNFAFTPRARVALEAHYRTRSLEEALDFPIRASAPRSVKPLYGTPGDPLREICDEFGVAWCMSDMDRGTPVGPPLAEPDLAGYRFPDAAAPWRYEGFAEWCARNSAHYTVVWVGDLWERATFMRGMENTLTDLALHPKFVRALLRGLTDFILETMENLFATASFDAVALSDDYGTQRGMIMSPRDWRRFIRPRLAEIYDLAKRHGRTVFHHSCGNIRPIIGDMIDVGLDILHPIQPEAMDVFRLKREFGRHLTFCGGVRTQDLLPTGTPEEVRREVRTLKRVMGEGGGYILEPGITLQADVPTENMVAMIEEALAGRE